MGKRLDTLTWSVKVHPRINLVFSVALKRGFNPAFIVHYQKLGGRS
jgi:hypothetical protein